MQQIDAESLVVGDAVYDGDTIVYDVESVVFSMATVTVTAQWRFDGAKTLREIPRTAQVTVDRPEDPAP